MRYVNKTKAGQVRQGVKEHYVRDDIQCASFGTPLVFGDCCMCLTLALHQALLGKLDWWQWAVVHPSSAHTQTCATLVSLLGMHQRRHQSHAFHPAKYPSGAPCAGAAAPWTLPASPKMPG